MRIKIKYNIFSLVFLSCFFANTVAAFSEGNKLEILMIHSYAPDLSWTQDQDSGVMSSIDSNLGDLYDIHYEKIYLDSKKTPIEKVELAAQDLKRKLATREFDFCVMTDDMAMKLFYSFIKSKSIPMVFAGINGNIEDYGYVKGDKNVSGTLERYNVLPMVLIMKKIRPTLDSILLLSEPDYTGKIILNEVYEQLSNSKLIKKRGFKLAYHVGNNFDDLKKVLLGVNPTKTMVLELALLTYRHGKNRHVPQHEIGEWIFKNTKFLDFGVHNFTVEAGRLLSVASSGRENGQYIGNLIAKSVKEGKSLNRFHIRQHLPTELVLNHARAKKIGINFSFEILAYTKSQNNLYHQYFGE